ncbi:hypothetical protein DFP97_101390 [Paenibacillus prosopidis]|uniref:Uncharacterized protein n=1 Tax=Paenibacillus prosopidis TaxID=630520 RepID=A0A368WE97_9BACL|nr:hypothetical protein DFP97_101390 [Paenibacillus prosopidis]
MKRRAGTQVNLMSVHLVSNALHPGRTAIIRPSDAFGERIYQPPCILSFLPPQ